MSNLIHINSTPDRTDKFMRRSFCGALVTSIQCSDNPEHVSCRACKNAKALQSLGPLSVFLDDEEVRVPRDGWVWVKTPDEAVELLKTGRVDRISLDNDLGLTGYGPMTEGKHVAAWIEAEAEAGRLDRLNVFIHTRNPEAGQQMKHAIRNAREFWRKREERQS